LLANGRKRDAAIWQNGIEHFLAGNHAYISALLRARHLPVSIDEFLESKEFWADQMSLWPALIPDIKAACPSVLEGEQHHPLALLGGATGTGKTAFGHTVNAYHLYCLTCFRQPQKMFGLPTSTPIVFSFSSVNATVTKRVIFQPFRTMFLGMPYTAKWVPHDKYKESELHLTDANIHVVPMLASLNSIVGQAIISAIVDEINFMATVENSKQVAGPFGLGGLYDQAEIMFTNINRRRKSRFVTNGPSWGVLCVSSSTRYKGDFLDRRISEYEEAREAGETDDALLFRHKQYEMQPKYAVQGYPTFRFLVGTDAYPGRVLTDADVPGQTYPENGLVENVPIDYLKDFRRDPEGSARDVIGIASLSISPFISQRHKILASILRTRDAGRQAWVDKTEVDLASDGMPQWNEAVLKALSPEEKNRKWFAHVDLSLTSDRCGIGISSVREYKTRIVGEGDDAILETVPVYEVGCSVAIKPSAMAQLDITAVRTFLMQLREFFGVNLYMVTYDGFQSFESVRAWRSAGIRSENISLDRGTEGYDYFRSTLYDDRIDLTDDDLLRQELIELEHIKKHNKVDHPPKGSKDVADGVAGSIYALSRSREVRTMIGYGKDEAGRPKATSRPAGHRPSGRDRPKAMPRKQAFDFAKGDEPSTARARVEEAQRRNAEWEKEQEEKDKKPSPAYDIRKEYGY
jgi:hypothetical protein